MMVAIIMWLVSVGLLVVAIVGAVCIFIAEAWEDRRWRR